MKTLTVLIVAMFLQSSTTAIAGTPAVSHTKSEGLATSIALGATLLPVGIGLLLLPVEFGGAFVGGALVLGGVFVGPSFGRVYAKDRKPFSLVPLRLGGFGVGSLGVGLMVVAYNSNEDDPSEVLTILGLAGVGAGTVMYFVGVVKDIGKAPKAVKKYNQRAMGATWRLSPAYYSASHAVGANLTLRF